MKIIRQVFGPTIRIPEYYLGCRKTQIPNTEYYLVLRKTKYRIRILLFGPTIRIVFEYRIIHHTLLKSGINKFYPCYECVFPKTSSVAPVTNCRESGIIGSITGFIGSMQVTEGIREIAFKKNSSILENSMAGYLFLYDGINQSLDKIKLTKNNKCPTCK